MDLLPKQRSKQQTMDLISDFLREQYALVKDAREVLFEYCTTIKNYDLIYQNPSFGHGGSIRNVLVHVANCYCYWVAIIALRQNKTPAEEEDCKNMKAVKKLFSLVDEMMMEFIDRMEEMEEEIVFEIDGIKSSCNPLKLFTHVTMHEFHHKGQVLSMSRHLGYIPVDTDILR